MSKRKCWKRACAFFLFCAAAAIVSPAQTFTTLVNFSESKGAGPSGYLIQGTDGNLHGTTGYGGNLSVCSKGCGAFAMTPAGKVTNIVESMALTVPAP